MNSPLLRTDGMRAIVTDIEGTTSSLSFVKDVLFPYAKRHLPGFVRAHRGESRIAAVMEGVRDLERNESLDEEAVVATLCHWIDEDRKVTPLKTIQGYVWEEGYRTGAFQGHVYEDAVAGLRAWHARGLGLYVFSSGSVAAQKLLFAHTGYGDLTALFSGFFDTTTGAKNDSSSYKAIASALALAPDSILFLSDTMKELDAARAAGMATAWLNRDGKQGGGLDHLEARTFQDLPAFVDPA